LLLLLAMLGGVLPTPTRGQTPAGGPDGAAPGGLSDHGARADSPRPARASFTLRVGGQPVPLRILGIAILPEGEVQIRREGAAGGRLSARSDGGRLRQESDDAWRWTAPPEPGFHTVRVMASQPADTIRVVFMVVRPSSEIRDGVLNGYRIGSYRPRLPSMSPAYEPPRGFIEARPEDYDLRISPNFRLGDFLCKQPGDPRYLLVSPRILIKLEALLLAVNEAGYVTPSLTVMSGFRTPAYNRAIGNTTDFSRHLWGDAADVYVDVDGDDQMDDLNRDGRSDVGDARWLARVVEEMMTSEEGRPTPGGLSVYRRNQAHGPFVHIDARGRRARW
ncbi:MAG: D-Ala-D-Ala carboxypeptidase family metallohydrolase, partial [Longimicrobiales bacterium]|nr:D-Ala-D-Ala carboxypeptidase family metallohydrolase [Longimicrobiales bacterium]